MTTFHNYNSITNLNSRSYSGSQTAKKKIKNFAYSTLDRIGKGYSSIVYKGINETTEQIVAVKAVDMKGVKDAISRQMLDCEIEALKTLNHDKILQCFDVIRQKQYCYIITQFCNQGDLSGLLKKKRRMTQTETLKILKDIVQGFIEIGNKGFLHRDLKLANILLTNDKAKIADFGFAKKFRIGSEKEKYNVGSPLYMSPQALKKNVYSLKNDIWSIGIMTYELLHGETPWQCKTEKQLLDKMTRIPVKFRQYLKISAQMKQFITRCLEVDEQKRMSLSDLQDWVKNQKVEGQSEENILGNKYGDNLATLNLVKKPETQIQKPKPASQMTRRLSENNNTKDKENSNAGRLSSARISKTLIEKNNSILVIEINSFRLLFKIIERLRKSFLEENDLWEILASEVIKRVNALKKCCQEKTSEYGLKQTLSYFDERSNPSIKKYKSVISEYYKKYTGQFESYPSHIYTPLSLKRKIAEFLQKSGEKFENEKDLLLGYWMIQFLGLSKQTTREQLDAIIQPKLKLNQSYICQRIKEIH